MKKEIRGVIAVDVGGTQLRAAFYPHESLEPLMLEKIPTKAVGEKSLERMYTLIRMVQTVNTRVDCIAIGVPGSLNPKKGFVYNTPNIEGWNNFPLVELVEKEFAIPCKIGNDANLAALGEWKYGAGIGHSNLLYFTISTGLGCGIIANNQLLTGAMGLAAEAGHTILTDDGPLCGCGKFGHFEAYSSGTGIAAYLSEQIQSGVDTILSENPTARDAAEAAKEGDQLSLEAFERAGHYLGRGIANMLHIFNPSIVVLGGSVTKAGSLIFDPFHQSLKEQVLSVAYIENLEIKFAELGDAVGLIGALTLTRIN